MGAILSGGTDSALRTAPFLWTRASGKTVHGAVVIRITGDATGQAETE
jgi:hypothetical protein